jgi:septum formation protein
MTILTAAPGSIVLASASPRRREILAGLGFGLVIDPSTIPEPERKRGETVAAYVVRAARIKTKEVAHRHHHGFVVGADTIVVAGGRILGKPSDDGEAREMLRSLSGRWHEVFTGISVIDNSRHRSGSTHCRSRVHMRRLTLSDIDGYLSTGEYRDKAGAYAIQGYASLFIDCIEGCYFNIVGFPVFTFAQLCGRLRGKRVNST